MKKHAISLKRIIVLGVFIAMVLPFFQTNIYAQPLGDILSKNAVTDTLYTKNLLARTFWLSSDNKIIVPHILYSGRSYYIKLAKNNPNDNVKLKVMISINSYLESLWDNVSSQNDHLILSLGNTQRVVFEISLDNAQDDIQMIKSVNVGLIINFHNTQKNTHRQGISEGGPPSPPEIDWGKDIR